MSERGPRSPCILDKHRQQRRIRAHPARQPCCSYRARAARLFTAGIVDGAGEGAEFARRLGCARVVLGRELTVDEIAKTAAKTAAEVEVFVHGALCVSYSGQCFSSEAWGGRSANRGQCAQVCCRRCHQFRRSRRHGHSTRLLACHNLPFPRCRGHVVWCDMCGELIAAQLAVRVRF